MNILASCSSRGDPTREGSDSRRYSRDADENLARLIRIAGAVANAVAPLAESPSLKLDGATFQRESARIHAAFAERFKQGPVVMLTVLSEPTAGYVLGADDYLVKPFKRDMLLNTLQRLITSQQVGAIHRAPTPASLRYR